MLSVAGNVQLPQTYISAVRQNEAAEIVISLFHENQSCQLHETAEVINHILPLIQLQPQQICEVTDFGGKVAMVEQFQRVQFGQTLQLLQAAIAVLRIQYFQACCVCQLLHHPPTGLLSLAQGHNKALQA